VPDRLFGRCERLLRRPPPRGHAPAAAARLASAAPPAPARRAARAAASSRRRVWRGAGSARPSPGARRVQSVHQSTGRPQQAAARSSAASSPSWCTACERNEAALVVAGAVRCARGLCYIRKSWAARAARWCPATSGVGIADRGDVLIETGAGVARCCCCQLLHGSGCGWWPGLAPHWWVCVGGGISQLTARSVQRTSHLYHG